MRMTPGYCLSMLGLLACTTSAAPSGADAGRTRDAGRDAAARSDGGSAADSSNATDGSSLQHDASADASAAADAATHPCSVDATDPSLPGVSVHVEADRCNFKSGQAAQFRYRVTLTQSIPYTAPASQGCGSCSPYSADASARISYTIGNSSGSVRYCICDTGCCAPNASAAFTLAPKTVNGTIDWPGRQWQGPSDTANPYGAAFPPGSYDVSVGMSVPGVGGTTAKLPITVQ